MKSLRYDCDGLGHREVMSYGGATCGFEANSTVVFPPGKYCFLQLSSTCPTGNLSFICLSDLFNYAISKYLVMNSIRAIFTSYSIG